MKCKPYEPASIRHKRIWDEAAASLGIHPAILREGFFSRWFTSVGASDFIDLIKRGEIKVDEFLEIKLTPEECEAKNTKFESSKLDQDFGDLLHYRLKTIIEVGDYVVANETKTYTFSGTQYLTKGKQYKIIELNDEGGSIFGAITKTDIKGEKNWTSVYGMNSVWRDGKEIYNWNADYLALWLEQNPNHPQTESMIEHCTKAAKLTSIGEE